MIVLLYLAIEGCCKPYVLPLPISYSTSSVKFARDGNPHPYKLSHISDRKDDNNVSIYK